MTLLSSDAFHQLNLGPGERSLRVALGDAGELGGVVLADGTFVSGHSAPFGGPAFSPRRLAPEDVLHGVDHAIAQLLEEGDVGRIVVRLPPGSYAPALAPFTHALVQRGFGITDSDLAFVVDVSGPADTVLHRNARAGARAAAHLRHEPADDVAEAWSVIAANCADKGYVLALDAAYVARAADRLGDAVRLRVLRDGERPVAAALLYDVAPEVELLVAWGDDPAYDGPAPMRRLAQATLAEAHARGTRLLDLGAATQPAEGRPVNAGLAAFKRFCGGRPEVRLTPTRPSASTSPAPTRTPPRSSRCPCTRT